MAAPETFRQQQRGVASGMAAALGVTVLTVAAWLNRGAAAPAGLVERLGMTARADLLVLCWLAAAIANVARLRFFSAEDIAGGGFGAATARVARADAVLRNTVEQAALAIPVHVALAVLVAPSVPLIVALAALFSLGRLLFWIGHARGPAARAFGFALTFYPSIAGLVVAMIAAARSLP